MPISHDAQAFIIDGRRTRLVSGSLCPSRIPRDEWDARLHDARMAGLNAVEVIVHWARHQPWPGALDFTGQNDIAEFLRLAQRRHLLAMVRVGPFVNAGLDLGGLPPWILAVPDCPPRSAAEAWISHATTFLTALASHIAPLQRTVSPEGPVVLVQVEHEWQCGDDDLADLALTPLGRALRESGIDVPIINRDNLYHAPVVSAIEGWNDHDTPHAITRQLRFLAPDSPPLLLGLRPGHAGVWGRKDDAPDPAGFMRHVAEAVAAGAQVNIDPLYAGTAFGFDGGRLASAPAAFLRPESMPGGSLLEADGRFGPAALAVRRLCSFATSFHRTLCHLDPDDQPVVLSPHDDRAVSVVPSRGRQGSVVWVFSPRKSAPRAVTLTLPDGESAEVHLPTDGVAWVLLDVHLFDRTTLDLCTLNAMALVGRTLVLYGRAGASGQVSINGAMAHVTVPRGVNADIETHEGVTLVICNEQSIDTTWFTHDTVHLGVAGLRPDGEPLPHAGHRTSRRVNADGSVQRVRLTSERTGGTPRLRAWSVADVNACVDGVSDRFVRLESPASLPTLGCPTGYAWLRATFRSTATRTVTAHAPGAGDRVALYMDGKPIGMLGVGPGAGGDSIRLSLKRRDHVLTALVDQLGRCCEGADLTTPTGLPGHLLELETIRAAGPKLEAGDALRLLDIRSPLFHVDVHDDTAARRMTWKFAHRRRSDVIVWIDPLPVTCALVVNDRGVDVLAPHRAHTRSFSADDLKRGDNLLQLAPVGEAEAYAAALRSAVRLTTVKTCLSEKWEWSFAEWEPPANGFSDVAADDMTARRQAHRRGRPAWWRTSFSAGPENPTLALDLTGMSKGQIFLNGVNFRRYFVAAADGALLDGAGPVLLPPSWLRHDALNDLLIFDEHGFAPVKVKLTAVR